MRVALGALCVATMACGVDAPPPTTVALRVSDAPPDYGDAPFPTDAIRAGAHLGSFGGMTRAFGLRTDAVGAALATLDGFGLRPLVELPLTGALDPQTLPAHTDAAGDPVGLVDVDPGSPERGRVIAMDWRYDDARQVIAGAPASGQLLREGTRYAAFATTALHDAAGAPLAPSPALGQLRDHARWQGTADALAALPDPTAVAGLAAFTTQHATGTLLAARAQLDQLAPPVLAFPDPALVFAGSAALVRVLGQATRDTTGARAGLEAWGNDNPTGIAHDHVGVLASGTITVARFRQPDTGAGLPTDGTFAQDASGAPILQAIEPIPITLIVPAAPPPPAGYPVVIYGHGLGASRDQLLSFAEPLTTQGYALVGIDMVGHGSRYRATDVVANMSKQLTAFSGVADGPDGFGDTTGALTQIAFFDDFQNVGAVRDEIRQSALDLSRVVQLLHRGDLDLTALGAGVHLDASHVAYLGESFGTVVGTLLAAIEPGLDLYVLDVPGGGILDVLLPNSPEIGALALPFIDALYAPAGPVDRYSPLVSWLQAVLDAGDPLTYAPHVLADRFAIAGAPLPPRSVVAIEVVGDQILPNPSTAALAQELGLDVLAPHLDAPTGLATIASPAAGNRDGQTAVLVQYEPATHGANWSSQHGTLRYAPGFPAAGADPFPRLPMDISIPEPMYATLAQVTDLLATHQAGAAPRVTMTQPPVADFDGDGVPDASDAAPLDPTRH